MDGKELRDALRNGRRVYGTMIVSPSPHWLSFVRQTGIDFVFIDTEHIPIERDILAWMCRAYGEMGLPPIVRTPSPDPFEVCKALDGGANGIIAPYVESVEQVRGLVGAAKLRPLKGKRLLKALENPETLEPGLKEYIEEHNAYTTLLVNIESVPAIENLDAILAVPGLDGVVIGPHDLSCSLGIPEQYEDPRFDEAVCTIIRKARETGLGAGIHFWEGLDLEVRWAQAGVNLLIHSGDIALFAQTLRQDVAKLRHALGDEIVKDSEGDIPLL